MTDAGVSHLFIPQAMKPATVSPGCSRRRGIAAPLFEGPVRACVAGHLSGDTARLAAAHTLLRAAHRSEDIDAMIRQAGAADTKGLRQPGRTS